MRRTFGTVSAAVAVVLGGCAVTGRMSDQLELVPQVESMQAAGKRLVAALTERDASIAAQAVTDDFRLADGAPTGGGALVVMVAEDLERYAVVRGGTFKVRQVLERTDGGEQHTLCELRFHGELTDGQRAEETRWMHARFRAVGAQWRMSWCNELRRHLVTGAAPTLFEDWTEVSGLAQTYREHLPAQATGFYPGDHHGGGVAAVDVDGDGDVDLIVPDGGGPRLWINGGNGTFTDGTVAAGLQPVAVGSARGVLCVDFDGDGHRDLFCTVFNGSNAFYRGLAGGRFAHATAAVGLTESGRYSSSAAAADLDNDGTLELYVCNFGDTRGQAVDGLARNGEPNRCYRWTDGRFVDVSVAVGLAETGFSLAVAFADADGDGDVDCYVANDFAFNRFFRNRGDGTFVDVTSAAAAADAGMGMGVTWADLDGDGDLDCYTSNMYSSVGHWIFDDAQYPVGGFVGFAFRGRVLAVLRKMAQGNSVLRNDGERFTTIGEESGAANAGWAWAAPAIDLDADGRTDLWVANGMITGPDATDT